MKIVPQGNTQNAAPKPTSADSARQRAISMLTTNSSSPQEAAAKLAPQAPAQTIPVLNATQVSPEEMTAITPAAPKVDTSTTVEAAETKPIPEKDPVLARQFEDLARQERILRSKAQKQQQEITQQREALEARQAELDAKAKTYEQGWISKDRLKQDTLSALAEAEISYDEVTQQFLNQESRNPRTEAQISRLEATIKALEGKINQAEENAVKAQDESYKSAVNQIRADANKLVKADPTTYETIAKTNAVDDVVELIERTYKEDGILMSVEEAAEEVENYLNDNLYETYNRIDKLKKRIADAKAADVATPAKQEVTPQMQNQQQEGAKTLTNAMGTVQKLSARERAILAFSGKKSG